MLNLEIQELVNLIKFILLEGEEDNILVLILVDLYKTCFDSTDIFQTR